MSNTLHRKDITHDEFSLLARFSRSLQVVEGSNGRLPWLVGEVEMWLPVWHQSRGSWQLSTYKPFIREALGLEVWAFRKICRYLCVKEADLIRTLYRLSMLAVVPGQRPFEPPKFRMYFHGEPISYPGCAPMTEIFGFLIERRRAEGDFRVGRRSFA